MKDIRLPGVGTLGADPAANASNVSKVTAPDPAQAFDAVMSRFAPRPTQQPAPPAREAERNTARQVQARRDAELRGEAQDELRRTTQNAQNAQAAQDTAARNAQAGRNPRPVRNETHAPDTRSAKPSAPAGKPAARDDRAANDADATAAPVAKSGPCANDEPAATLDATAAPVATTAPYDAAALAALAASLANPANAARTGGIDGSAPPAGKKTAADGTDGKAVNALDVFAARPIAYGRHGAAGNDPRAAVTADGDGTPGGARRAALESKGTKDTLRIEAPLMRALDVTQATLAERFTATVTPETTRNASSLAAAAQLDAPSPLLAANLAATASVGTPAGTYSIAHAAVAAPVGSYGFGEELSQKVVMFAGQKLQRADIAVTPADLGPIAVSIEVRGQEATLAFAAASAATRTAIENALPQLKDMLSAQGLQLAGAHVGGDPRRDSYKPSRGDTPARSGVRGIGAAGAAGDTDALAATTVTQTTQRRVSLIDIEV